MRKTVNFNKDWIFILGNDDAEKAFADECRNFTGEHVDLPHTWNGKDGQDGGNDYVRCVSSYAKKFPAPPLERGGKAYLQFKGVNSTAHIYLNGKKLFTHDGGYSKFRVDITDALKKENLLVVLADNRKNDTVYPQTADFTFYGGIYRDVDLITLSPSHFDMDHLGSPGIKITPEIKDGKGIVCVKSYVVGGGEVHVTVLDGSGKVVATEIGEDVAIEVPSPHLWNGVKDPYLYTVKAELMALGEYNSLVYVAEYAEVADEVSAQFGFRSFYVDPEKGFFLNGRSYPLRGVCRHQDRPLIGNAIIASMHEEDIALIKEIGANTVRLSHYQHDDYFYELCDRAGLVVWAEIPYISKHMDNADDNAVSQMRELIAQQYNHPCIVCWCISNEITMHGAGADRLECHKKINAMCHKLDDTRLTVLACYMIKRVRNKLNYVTDLVSYNLYHGWYLPFFSLAGRKLDRFHRAHKTVPLGLSEYGAEAMTGLHAEKPKRGDNTEEYQCIFHEKYLDIIEQRPYLWATHVWNMFDFAADARNQGGEPGMNHKGLITFDRKIRKDAFYLYKAYWSDEPFIHICGKRFVNRCGKTTHVTVYTNAGGAELYNNGELIGKQSGKVCKFIVPLSDKNSLTAKCGEIADNAEIIRVDSPDPSYKLRKKGNNKSWEKQ